MNPTPASYLRAARAVRTGLGGGMGEFVAELGRRLRSAEESLASARADGDDYLANVRSGELDSLRRLADAHGISATGDVLASSS